MVGYRCYVLDAEDHILQAHDLECETDEHAAALAETLLNQDPYYRFAEVWRSTRRIAKLERHLSVRMRIPSPVVRSLGSAA
jgi:hypothetical protein